MNTSIYLIVAAERHDREQALKKFSPKPVAVSEVTPPAVAEALNSRSLFSTESCVLIPDAETLDKKTIEIVVGFCKNPAPFTTLVMTAAKRPAGLYQVVNKVGEIIEIAPRNLREWLVTEARELGKNLSSDSAAALTASVGEDKTLLARELEKLVCYVGEREGIDLADISAVATGIPHESVWALRSAVMQRKTREALVIWRELAVMGTAPLAVIALLRSQFHTCRALLNGSKSIKLSGWRRDRTLAEARQYGLVNLGQGLVTLHDAELRLKSNESVPMEMVLAQLC